MHFTYLLRSVRMSTFRPPPSVIQPSVIPFRADGRDVRDTRYVFTFSYRTETLLEGGRWRAPVPRPR